MQVLRVGSRGEDVERWENFLVGEGFPVEVNDLYDEATKEATIKFQTKHGLNPDGEVGRFTYGRAMLLGFDPTVDTATDEASKNWPAQTLPTLSYMERLKLFGSIPFTPAPTNSNPEAILITPSWVSSNITQIEVPQLKRFGASRVSVNKRVADQLLKLCKAWDDAGLMPLVLSFDGLWAPRFVRGSRTTLSAHSWGTALDVNATLNGLGKTPPLVGKKGSVRKLVPIAEQCGWSWGGFYKNRPDGMHFEVAKIL